MYMKHSLITFLVTSSNTMLVRKAVVKGIFDPGLMLMLEVFFTKSEEVRMLSSSLFNPEVARTALL